MRSVWLVARVPDGLRLVGIWTMAALLMGAACAADDGASARDFKLTFGDYLYHDAHGQDVNLRWQHGDTHAWLGEYSDASFGRQWRTGIDGAFELAPALQLMPSVQVASGGFVGGSVNVQWGHPWYVLAGWGRTNLRPYFNLNFDPNDAVTFGAGHQADDGSQIALTLIADDRLHTGQRDWHLQGRWPVWGDQRLTLDLLRKTGLGDGGPVRAWGWTAGWDWPAWFLRIARDPKQNFSTQDATRLSAGVRF
ncbi:MAG: hypothetical protein ABI574_15600 [Burkholderiales bacterium]